MSERASERLRTELRVLRDVLLRSIDGVVLGDVEDGLELYARLVNGVLESRASLEQRYQVAPPSSWLGRHGQEMEWLNDDLRAFVERAWKEPNQTVLGEMITFLVRLLDSLRRSNRMVVHSDVLDLGRVFYFHSLAHSTRSGRSIGSRMLGAVREYLDFFVLHTGDARTEVDLEVARQVVDFLVRCARLATQENPARLPEALRQVDELIDNLERRRRRIDYFEVEPDELRIEVYLGGYLLGLLGDVLHRSERGLIDAEETPRLVGQIRPLLRRLPVGFSLIEALGDRRGGGYPWANWEMESWPVGQHGGAIGAIEEWIRVAAVVELASQPELMQVFESATKNSDPDASFLFSSLAATAERSSNDVRLRTIYPHEASLDRLVELSLQLSSSAAELAELERDRRAQLAISAPKVATFTSAVAEEWSKRNPLRGSLVETTAGLREPPTDWFGFNSLVPKDFFVESDVHADPASLGHDVGSSLVRGEVARVIEILDELPREALSLAGLPAAVQKATENLVRRGLQPLIVVVDSWRAQHALAPDAGYGASGPVLVDGVPLVFEHADHEAACYVVDLGKTVGVSRWKAEPDEAGFALAVGGLLAVFVREVTDELAASLLESNPRLGLDDDGVRLDSGEARRRLRRQVHIRVWSKVEIEVAEPEGFAFTIIEDVE